jgi:hypothetical protein
VVTVVTVHDQATRPAPDQTDPSPPAAPVLTTGWEPDLDDGDSLALRWLRHLSAQCATLVDAAGGTVVGDARYLLADHRRPAAYYNSVVLLAPQPEPGRFDELLDEIEARTAGGAGEVHLWSLWPTPDLTPRGWQLDGHPPLLVRPPTTMLPAPAIQAGSRPEPVRTADELAVWERVAVEGYPMPDLLPVRPGVLVDPSLLDDDRWRFWTTSGEDGAQAVSISAQFVAHGLAGFALGVTLPAARRGGHWARHAAVRLAAEPDRWHVGVFADTSRPSAERHGFLPVLRHTLWHRPR